MIKTICTFAAGFAVAAWIGWEASPSYIDKDGILREAFALVSLSAASRAVTIGTGTFLIIKRVRS